MPKPIPEPAADATSIEKADVKVAQAAAEVQDTPPVRALASLAEIGDQPPMFALSALTAAAGWWRRDTQLMRAGIRMLAAEAVATLAKDAIKRTGARTRPELLIEEGRYELKRGGPYTGKWNSFPSGHTAGAVAVSRALVREYPKAKRPAYAAAATIAAAQVPACNHYPSDIGAGAVIGLASEWLVDRGMRAATPWFERRAHRMTMSRREAASRMVG